MKGRRVEYRAVHPCSMNRTVRNVLATLDIDGRPVSVIHHIDGLLSICHFGRVRIAPYFRRIFLFADRHAPCSIRPVDLGHFGLDFVRC